MNFFKCYYYNAFVEMGNNGGIMIGDGLTRMRLGANGLTIESANTSAVIIFDPVKNQVIIGQELINNVVDVDVNVDINNNAEHVNENDIGNDISIPQISSHSRKPIDLCIEGKIVDRSGQDYQRETFLLKEEISALKEKITQLELKLDMVYNAPGMPGYLLSEENWNNVVQQD